MVGESLESCERFVLTHDVPAINLFTHRLNAGGEDVFGRMLKNVKINFRSLSPRAFVFIRVILTLLLNSYLVFRIVSFSTRDKISTAASYTRLKGSLNEDSSFFQYLVAVIKEWSFSPVVLSRTGSQAPSDDEDAASIDEINVPRNKRLQFFNKPDGKRLRLSKVPHERCLVKKLQCYICKMQTTAHCSTCKINLCSTIRHQQEDVLAAPPC